MRARHPYACTYTLNEGRQQRLVPKRWAAQPQQLSMHFLALALAPKPVRSAFQRGEGSPFVLLERGIAFA